MATQDLGTQALWTALGNTAQLTRQSQDPISRLSKNSAIDTTGKYSSTSQTPDVSLTLMSSSRFVRKTLCDSHVAPNQPMQCNLNTVSRHPDWLERRLGRMHRHIESRVDVGTSAVRGMPGVDLRSSLRWHHWLRVSAV